MGANSFHNDRVDHDLEDANARWRAYLSLMRKTGAIERTPGLDDEPEPPDEQAWSKAASGDNGWSGMEDDIASHDQHAERSTRAETGRRPADPIESEPLGASNPKNAGVVLDQPRSPRRHAPLYLVAGAFLCLAGFSAGVLHYGRRDEPPQFETWAKPQPIGRTLDQPTPPRPRAVEQAYQGRRIAAASALPVAMSLKHDIRLASLPSAVPNGSVRRHPHKAHAKRICAHCRAEADTPPHAPLPPIWPDGKTLDVPAAP